MKEIYDSTKMENNYTDPKKLGSDGNYTDLRVLLDHFSSEPTALGRLIKYKQDNTVSDIDNNYTARKKYVFKPIADVYKLLWNVDVTVNSVDLINSGETIVASNLAFRRANPNIPHKRGGFFSIKWEELRDEKYMSDSTIQSFAHAVATIGNFIPVPGAEQKMLTFLEERFDKELKIIQAYYCCSEIMGNALPESICKWLNLYGKGNDGWISFVDKNFFRGSFVDVNYNVVCYDDSLEQLTEIINARSKVMLDIYSQRWEDEQSKAKNPND